MAVNSDRSDEIQSGLKENEKSFRALFEQSVVGIAYAAVDGRWLQVNQKFCSITGYSHDELLYRTMLDITYCDDIDKAIKMLQSLLEEKMRICTLEKRYVRKDGALTWVNLTVSLVQDSFHAPLYFVLVIEDINERKRMEEQQRMIEENKQRMEEFLGLASHELRTPLTTIKMNVQLALRRLQGLLQDTDELSPNSTSVAKIDEVRNMLGRAECQVDVLNRLLGEMLDISYIRNNKLQLLLRPELCNLVEIAWGIVERQRKVWPERTIIMHPPTDAVIPVMADSKRIGQVLANFLHNALKYSATNKPVELWLVVEDAYVRVSVRDEGPGLSEEEQQRVWECFYRAPNSKIVSGSDIGLGLSLYISRVLIEKQHGLVGVRSSPHQGSTFWFMLPLAQQRDA